MQAAEIKQKQTQTGGGGGDHIPQLSKLEERVVALMGKTAVKGMCSLLVYIYI